MSKEEPGEKDSLYDFQNSLEVISSYEGLSPAGRKLAENVLKLGRVFPLKKKSGEVIMVLDVKQFLNHRVDTDLMMMIGMELADDLRDLQPDFVLTAPSSGITPAFAAAINLGKIPLIYTQKSTPITFDDGPVFQTNSFSYTTNKLEPMTASGFCIPQGQRGVVIDDFLDTGKKSTDLMEITRQAGSFLVGLGYAIEKAAVGGRARIIDSGISRIHSVLNISDMQPGRIKINGIPNWLSLKNNGYPR